MTSLPLYPNPWPPELARAFAIVWQSNQDSVQKYQLGYEPGAAIGDSVYATVRCSNSNVDSYDLLNVFRKIEGEVRLECARQGFDFDVTLVLATPDFPAGRPSNEMR